MAGNDDSQGTGFQLGSAGVAIGLIVFLAGIVMVVLVFMWGYDLLHSLDEQLIEVHYVSTLGPGQPAESEAQVAAAEPGGPSIIQAATTVALKFLGLLVLGWLGAMVAGKGAEMTGVRRRLQG